MKNTKILALVMAGGEGSRLHPLTAERSKPSVPFGARYRIVDFVLSNLVNSDIPSIYLLVQYKSQSLIEHVRKAWVLPPTLPDHFVTVVPPQMRSGQSWFQGTANAVFQNINLIRANQPDLVLVFGADHIYRMDVRQMVQFHHDCNADATIAALPVPLSQASGFGIIDADENGLIRGFMEKPVHPPVMDNNPERAYASMGNYIFNTEVLIQALEEANERGEHDFGQHVLPRLKETHKLYAYFDAHMNVLGLEPRFDIFNANWPIISSNYQGPVAKFFNAELDNSIVSAGCLVNGAKVKNCVLRREVVLEPGVELENCLVMDSVVIRRGAKLKRAIVDRYNVIEKNARIGFDLEADRARYTVTDSGIVVIPEAKYYELERTSFGEKT